MCGICGILLTDRSLHVAAESLAAMNRRMVHRGPDEEGFFIEGNVGLGMRRLSVIDLASGHQPLSNENGDLWIVFNGEIYNHADLRRSLEAKGHHYRTHSDTETIVHAYEEYGRRCVNHLHGMFAFAIWDRRKKVLFAARDRLGIKPFYYRYDREFLFASEIKAILAFPGVSAELNRGILAEYLAFGYLTGPQTMFAGIQKLMPGHILEISELGKLTLEPYWDLPNETDMDSRPREYYVLKYREMLEAAVQSHLMSDVPLGVFLSGGLDSSAVAALATKIRGTGIKTFAVGYGRQGEAEAMFSELAPARQVATHLGSDHHEIHLSQEEFFDNLPTLIWHEDEPIVWPSSVALFSVARLAKEHVTVVLTGEGSDETLAGYTRYAWTLVNARMDTAYRWMTTNGMRRAIRRVLEGSPMRGALRRKMQHTFLVRDGNSWPSFYYDNFLAAFSSAEQENLLTAAALASAGDAYEGSMATWEGSQGDLLHRLLKSDIKSYLIELLMKQDQMSMAASVESRVPYLDHELAEFAATIPAQYLISGMGGKLILKLAVSDLLPSSIVYRRKMGFPTPWEHWLAGPKLDCLQQLLVEPRSLERGLFRHDAVKRIFDEHRSKARDHSNRIWRLLNLEVWHRVFLDSQERNGSWRYRKISNPLTITA